jgi:hypothetical protein
VVNAYELEIAYRDLDNVLALYQNERIEAAMERLLSRPEPRFLEPIPRPASPPPAARSAAPPRSGKK